MQLNPYLSFNGQCEAAFKFYEERLGGKILSMFPWGATPAANMVGADWQQKIIHGTISVGGHDVMGCDAPPGRYSVPTGIQLSLSMKDPAEAERLFNALAENGKVIMALEKTFWAARFGMVTDQFGIPWMINCEQPS